MKSNLKIILRDFKKNPLYATINIVGLAVCLTVTIYILLWAIDEFNVDRFHTRSSDIYQTNVKFKDMDWYWSYTNAPLAFTAKDEIPEIENACRFYPFWTVEFLQNRESNKIVNTEIACGMVDSTFFSIFDFQIIEGDPKKMLVDYESIVISDNIAKQLFGDDYPIGKILFDNHRQYRVTGIIAEMPVNSSIRFNVLLPFTLFEQINSGASELTAWDRVNFQTWFLLRSRTNVIDVEEKIAELVNQHVPDELIRYSLQSFVSLNMYNADGSANTKAQTFRIFIFICFLVILTACINYVNISTARATRRNKEVFLKNIFGVKKINLFMQFLTDSILIIFVSLITSTILLKLFLPAFNDISMKNLDFQLFSYQTLTVYVSIFLTVVFFGAFYPAINLTVMKPLQGIRYNRGNTVLRRVLVVVQFIFAIVLIVVTITTTMQLEYIRNKNLGYDKENVFYVGMSNGFRRNFDFITSELQRNPYIMGVTATHDPLKEVATILTISDIEGIVDTEEKRTILLRTDNNFIPTMNIKLVEGLNFDDKHTKADNVILLNETAVKQFGISDPIGKTCNVWGGKKTIIGVVQDFHYKNLNTAIEPLVIVLDNNNLSYLYVRTSTNSASQAIETVEMLWQKLEPDTSFSYQFVDDEFNIVYKSYLQVKILFRIFALIAILVSCLGLFGLITYIAETKNKEIGIRKVLGASIGNIVYMLSKEFFILVCISMLIAFPLAYFWADRMLQVYAYRIEISWWIFAITGIIIVTLILLTIGWKAIKAATVDPARVINTE